MRKMKTSHPALNRQSDAYPIVKCSHRHEGGLACVPSAQDQPDQRSAGSRSPMIFAARRAVPVCMALASHAGVVQGFVMRAGPSIAAATAERIQSRKAVALATHPIAILARATGSARPAGAASKA